MARHFAKIHTFDNSNKRFNGFVEKMLIEISEKLSAGEVSKITQDKIYLFPLSRKPTMSRQSNFLKFRIILLAPGRLRWLCLNLAQEIFSDAYAISRWRLILRIFRYWNFFRSSVLNRIYITNAVMPSTSIHQFSYLNKLVFFEFEPSTTYLLESSFLLTSRFLSQMPKKTLLELMLIWNFEEALFFLKILLSKDRKLEQQISMLFPDLARILSQWLYLKVIWHPNANEVFDDKLINSKGFDVLENIEILHQRFILKDLSLIQIDSTCSNVLPFVAGHWQFIQQNSNYPTNTILLKPDDSSILYLKSAIYLMGRADENWYHMLMDTLPRYLFMQDLDTSIPVLVRDDLPLSTMDFLQKFLSRELIKVGVSQIIHVDSLYVCPARSTVFDSEPPQGESYISFSPKSIELLTNLIVKSRAHLSMNAQLGNFYLERGAGNRSLLNESKVIKICSYFGYNRVTLDNSFYLRQVEFFNNADVVVSPGGAVLANLVFMKPGKTILVLHNRKSAEIELWKKLAEASKVEFIEIVGFPTYFGLNSLRRLHSNYFVSPKKLRRMLSREI